MCPSGARLVLGVGLQPSQPAKVGDPQYPQCSVAGAASEPKSVMQPLQKPDKLNSHRSHMHLQQTKRASRVSGGPQYYFHDLADEVGNYLRNKRAVPVALVTPYGATPSKFMALSAKAKLSPDNKVVAGKVGHDRVQQAAAGESIGEAIRRWYRLPSGDFERIDVEIQILDAKFYLTPVSYKYAGQARRRKIERPEFPLSFNHHKKSLLWQRQLEEVRKDRPEMWQWSIDEICRVVSAHGDHGRPPNVQEQDLLRASGPLKILGVECGPYVGKGYDCQGKFQFLGYEPYWVPLEIKKQSSRFEYQQKKYAPEELSRVVILCARHDLINVPPNVDVIELNSLCSVLGK